jgi:hypothetical protein
MNTVFVHLGDARVDYLWSNINYLNRTAPQENITLILNNKIHLKKISNLKCDVHFYESSEASNNLFSKLEHKIEFRNGFWRHSTERFFALQHWHQLNPNNSFLHLESDNLLLPNFPWKKFESLQSLAWLRHNDEYDCAALLYSSAVEETNWFIERVTNCIELDKSMTDMKALSIIAKQNPGKVQILPTCNERWIHDKPNLNLEMDLSKNFKVFNGVFDPAATGVWLTGGDPRNSLGWIKRYKNHFNPIIDPSTFDYSLKKMNVYVTKNGVTAQLFNLHIHSKQKILFSRLSFIFLKLYVYSAHKLRIPRIFHFISAYYIFLSLISLNKFNISNIYKGIRALIKTRKTELFN